MAETIPTIEKYARLRTKNWKQIYAFDSTDVNFKQPYQIFMNTYSWDLYIWKGGWLFYDIADYFVYEWANFREWTEDDWMALLIANQKITKPSTEV